jgi:DNA-binding NarL/FixJ family response regulator
MTPIRVVIVDDHGIVRDGIRQVFASDDGFVVAGEASTGAAAIELVMREAPDVVLLDITMPGMSGVEVARALRERGTTARILMLSVHDEATYVLESVRKGAHGYVRKDTTPADLRAAVRAVHAGDAYFSPAVASRLADAVRADPNAVVDNQVRAQQRVESLTHREREVLVAITRGLLNKEIASEFSISVRTVEAHRESIMRKLGVRTVAAMTRVALDGGLLNESG